MVLMRVEDRGDQVTVHRQQSKTGEQKMHKESEKQEPQQESKNNAEYACNHKQSPVHEGKLGSKSSWLTE